MSNATWYITIPDAFKVRLLDTTYPNIKGCAFHEQAYRDLDLGLKFIVRRQDHGYITKSMCGVCNSAKELKFVGKGYEKDDITPSIGFFEMITNEEEEEELDQTPIYSFYYHDTALGKKIVFCSITCFHEWIVDTYIPSNFSQETRDKEGTCGYQDGEISTVKPCKN